MPIRRCRPFTILDAMILVAATAVGLALARTIVGDAIMMPRSPMWVARPITYLLLAWTLAFLPLRLRNPRPPLRRLMRQPGMVACAAVAVVVLIDATSWGTYWAKAGPRTAGLMLERFWRGHSQHPGPAVAVAWLGLALGRRARPEPGWIDRIGRFIGVLWLLTLACDWRFGRWISDFLYRLWT